MSVGPLQPALHTYLHEHALSDCPADTEQLGGAVVQVGDDKGDGGSSDSEGEGDGDGDDGGGGGEGEGEGGGGEGGGGQGGGGEGGGGDADCEDGSRIM